MTFSSLVTVSRSIRFCNAPVAASFKAHACSKSGKYTDTSILERLEDYGRPRLTRSDVGRNQESNIGIQTRRPLLSSSWPLASDRSDSVTKCYQGRATPHFSPCFTVPGCCLSNKHFNSVGSWRARCSSVDGHHMVESHGQHMVNTWSTHSNFSNLDVFGCNMR